MNTLKSEGILLGAYANRLTQVDPNWTMADSEAPQPLRTDLDPADYCTDYVAHWVALNVQIIGGCCGISPEHIAYINDYLRSESGTKVESISD
jgi:homocysteine S-methyltransferase